MSVLSECIAGSRVKCCTPEDSHPCFSLFIVKKPEGGVQEGQVFLTPLPETFDNPRIDAPTGKWKDGLLNCCSLGFLHSSFWCALCCTQIAMAQVMARMQLTWLGEPGSLISTKSTYKVRAILYTILGFVRSFAKDVYRCVLYYTVSFTALALTHTQSLFCSHPGGLDTCSRLSRLLDGLGTGLYALRSWRSSRPDSRSQVLWTIPFH
jgi:hypothetical protein